MIGKEELKNLALSLFTKLFTVEPTSGDGTFIKGSFPTLSEEQRLKLEKDYSITEHVKR